MLTLRTLPLRNLLFHWRSNLPVLLGSAIGAAVLVGALLVGDSLKGSLKAKAERQLNGVTSAWIGSRFIRQEIEPSATPTILLRGTVETDGRRATNVTIVGLPADRSLFRDFKLDGAVLNQRLAAKLNAQAGSALRINFEKPSKIPRSSLLGNRSTDDSTLSLRIATTVILPVSDPANVFSISPSPGLPLIVYVPLEKLQQRLAQAGKINAIFRTDSLSGELKNVTLDDWGLTVRTERVQPQGRKVKGRELPYLSLESDRFVLDDATLTAVQSFISKHPGWRAEPTVSYLAISLAANGKEIPYSIVTGLNPKAEAPLGPLLPNGLNEIGDNEIVLTEWPDSPLKNLKKGDIVSLTYFQPEIESDYVETTVKLTLAGTVPFAGVAIDPSLTPQFPGITDKLSVRDWKPPFPYDSTKIKPNDFNEQYWQDYRTTPKAYLSLATARKLFKSRFGTTTSLRIAPPSGMALESAAEEFRTELLRLLDPQSGGFTYEPFAERLREAGKGGQDFGGLFLGFSFFLILAALLLVGLLFRLATEQRAKQVGLLLATGYSPSRIRNLLLAEGSIIAAIGSIIGVLVAIPYAKQLLSLLIAQWPDDSIGSFLQLHVTPLSLVMGGLAGWLTAMIAMFLAVRSLVRISPPQLLRGVNRDVEFGPYRSRRWVAISAIVLAVVLIGLGFVLPHPDAKAGSFFGSGALLLIAGLLFVRNWLRSPHSQTISSINTLAIHNARANPGRSLLTVSLVAIASFLLVAVESFRRPAPSSQWMGYTHLAEVDTPLFQSIDSGPGLEEWLTNLEKIYSERPGELSPSELKDKARQRLIGIKSIPLRLHSGDDASCLNLFQASKPNVVGVPNEFFEKLTAKAQASSGIATVVEQNTLMWMLKKSVGGTIDLPDGNGQTQAFRFVDTLTDSPFQSELLIRDSDFKANFPRDDGYRSFLITMPPSGDVSDLLESGFIANGLSVTPVREKIAGFQAVIGAYLTMFQLLGGFGLLLGVAGLAVVLIRGVWERSSEFSLLQAVGYSPRTLLRIVLIENVFLLLLGLVVGVVAAIGSVLPHMIAGGTLPLARLAILLGAFVVIGSVVAWFATRFALNRPLLAGLRAD